jgi:hypothetical protein
VYQVSSFSPHEPHWVPFDTVTVEITGDSLYPNNKRYYLYNSRRPERVDSTDGRVYSPLGAPHTQNGCPDSTEEEVYDLTVDSTFVYYKCGDGIGSGPCTISPLGSERVGALNLSRQQRVWHCWVTQSKLAQGIGISQIEGGSISGNQHLLIYARINGTEYWPVELRSFTATLQQDKSVLLRWETENEVQNLGFTVQRRTDGDEQATWTDLAFVAAAAAEGQGGEYSFTHHVAAADAPGSVACYRLRQHDYDGTVTYSPVVEVRLAQPAGLPNIHLYPNPVQVGTAVNIDFEGSHSGDLQLHDVFGRRVLSLPPGGRATIPTEGLAPGIYFLRVSRTSGVAIEKLLLQ